MDTTQLLLSIILTITTIILIIVGIQLIFILRDLRQILKKVNFIINSFEKIGLSANHGFAEVLGFFTSLKAVFKIIDILHTGKKNGKNK